MDNTTKKKSLNFQHGEFVAAKTSCYQGSPHSCDVEVWGLKEYSPNLV
jgi:hypothetical protein